MRQQVMDSLSYEPTAEQGREAGMEGEAAVCIHIINCLLIRVTLLSPSATLTSPSSSIQKRTARARSATAPWTSPKSWEMGMCGESRLEFISVLQVQSGLTIQG